MWKVQEGEKVADVWHQLKIKHPYSSSVNEPDRQKDVSKSHNQGQNKPASIKLVGITKQWTRKMIQHRKNTVSFGVKYSQGQQLGSTRRWYQEIKI